MKRNDWLMFAIAVGVWVNAVAAWRPVGAGAQEGMVDVNVVAVSGRRIGVAAKGLPVQIDGGSVVMPCNITMIADNPINGMESRGLSGNVYGAKMPVVVPR